MKRRKFLALFGAFTLQTTLRANAQSTRKIARVGVLWHASNAEEEDVYLSVLRKAFSDLGHVEEKNLHLEHRFPAENPERFRIMARELVELNPDAIIAVTTLGANELKSATSKIPIVFVLGQDPVRDGLVDGLARPGGNATGLSLMSDDLTAKRLALLKEAFPMLSRIGLLVDPTIRARQNAIVRAHETASQQLGISLGPIEEIATADGIEMAMAKMVKDGVNALSVGPGSQLFNLRKLIGASALAHKLPAIGIVGESVPYGLLFSYGQDLPDFFRRAVVLVDKILKGAKPADLPVEQPTKLKLILNRKTATTFGIQLPPTLVAVADDVID
jgi:putative ABC transport system substrate-binding protein